MKILYFYAVGCIHCNTQQIILNRIKEDYPEVIIININSNEEFDYIKKYNPTESPEVVFIHKNKEVDRISGLAHREIIEEIINKFNK